MPIPGAPPLIVSTRFCPTTGTIAVKYPACITPPLFPSFSRATFVTFFRDSDAGRPWASN